MAKLNYKQRILNLIELDRTDSQIRNDIYKEYNIVVKLSDIQSKRKPAFKKQISAPIFKNSQANINIIKSILTEYVNVPLTKKDIGYKIYQKYDVNIGKIEIKNILWNDLRNEIKFDASNSTYQLKYISNDDEVKIEPTSMLDFLKNKISTIQRELYGKIEIVYLKPFVDEYLYDIENDIDDFDINDENHKGLLINLVDKNYSILKKYHTIIQNISDLISYKSELIDSLEGIIKTTDLDQFISIFKQIFEEDEEVIMINDKKLFNQTKDELEFLFEINELYLKKINSICYVNQNNYKQNQVNEILFDKDDFKKNDNNFNSTKISLEENFEILIDNVNFKVKYININKRSLFTFEYINCEYEIKINNNHQIFNKKYNKELIVKIILSLISAKSEFSSLESEELTYKFLIKLDSILQII